MYKNLLVVEYIHNFVELASQYNACCARDGHYCGQIFFTRYIHVSFHT